MNICIMDKDYIHKQISTDLKPKILPYEQNAS